MVCHPSYWLKFPYSRKTSNCSNNYADLTIVPRKLIELGNTPMIRSVHFCLLNAHLVNNKTLEDLLLNIAMIWYRPRSMVTIRNWWWFCYSWFMSYWLFILSCFKIWLRSWWRSWLNFVTILQCHLREMQAITKGLWDKLKWGSNHGNLLLAPSPAIIISHWFLSKE